MEEERLALVPDSLFNISIAAIVRCPSTYNRCRQETEFETLPPHVLFGIVHGLYTRKEQDTLYKELQDWKVFSVILQITDMRTKLHSMVQYLMDHNMEIIRTLTEKFQEQMAEWQLLKSTKLEKLLTMGLNLGGFYAEAGWFEHSAQVYWASFVVSRKEDFLHYALECCIGLCHILKLNYKYAAAKEMCQTAFLLVERLKQNNMNVNCALLHAEKSTLLCALSSYSEAFTACSNAMQGLNSCLPVCVVISVLTQCAEVYVVKGEFKTAEELVKLAVFKAKEYCGSEHPVYANVLMVYGYFLFKKSALDSAVCVYKQALSIYLKVFGGLNFQVAFAHKDLAKVTFRAGRFTESIKHIKKAVRSLIHVRPQEHYFTIFFVKTTLSFMELIALFEKSRPVVDFEVFSSVRDKYLELCKIIPNVYGDCSMHMANLYHEVGPLFKIVGEYDEAERTYIKGIDIVTSSLGVDHYEVAPLEGRLAALYNRHMKKYDEAERLYKHYIYVIKSAFGEDYFSLGAVYWALYQLHFLKGADELAQQYLDTLSNWKFLRAQKNNAQDNPFVFDAGWLKNIISKLNLS